MAFHIVHVYKRKRYDLKHKMTQTTKSLQVQMKRNQHNSLLIQESCHGLIQFHLKSI